MEDGKDQDASFLSTTNHLLKPPKELAEDMFGPVDWISPDEGYCPCPGQSRHTHPTRAKDCRIWLAGVPSLHCFHDSCRAEVESANHRFRSAVARGAPDIPMPA